VQGLPERHYDLLMRDPSGELVGVEVKSTRVRYLKLDPQQVAFDALTMKSGSEITSGPQAGRSLGKVYYFGYGLEGVKETVWATKVLQQTLKSIGVETTTVRHNGGIN
jgi:hypothetical protein